LESQSLYKEETTEIIETGELCLY